MLREQKGKKEIEMDKQSETERVRGGGGESKCGKD